jgi:glutamyl-tRNA reductase
MFADISKHKALLVGAGDTIELVTRHLIELGLNDFTIVNRNLERAQNMANELGGHAGSLDSIDEHLHTADIVISSTAAANTVISAASVSAAFKKRKHRPMLMIDLAVPRDIDPLVEELNDVYLYTVDHLSDIIQQGKEARFKAAESAEIIVTAEVEKFSSQQAGRSAVNTIKALRDTTNSLSNEVTQRALNRLAAGHDSSEVVVELARSLSQKLLHNPTTAIRKAAESNNQGLLDAAHTLFDISHPSKSDHQEKPE